MGPYLLLNYFAYKNCPPLMIDRNASFHSHSNSNKSLGSDEPNESRQSYLKIEPTTSKASRSNKVGVQKSESNELCAILLLHGNPSYLTGSI